MTYGPLRLSCVFLTNYVSKYQMSSGPYGPIFDKINLVGNNQSWSYRKSKIFSALYSHSTSLVIRIFVLITWNICSIFFVTVHLWFQESVLQYCCSIFTLLNLDIQIDGYVKKLKYSGVQMDHLCKHLDTNLRS